MNASAEPRILCVDDDPMLLDGLRRSLGDAFDIETAQSGQEGLERLDRDGPFAVIVSDMRMPNMNGAQFLARARVNHPDTVRVLLTGQADADAAMAAVNEGGIFRFLSKPCARETLAHTLEVANQHYLRVTAERELLEKTLTGSMRLLSDVLALASPEVFSRSTSLRGYVHHMATKLDPEHAWQYETAALLSQLGCIALAPATVERIQAGLAVSEEDRRAYEAHPKVAHRLLSPIPRLTEVAEMIARQRDPRAASGADPTSLGAAMIALASELDFQVARGVPMRSALDRLREDRAHRYPDRLIDALSDYSPCETATATVRFSDLALGAVFEQDVMTKTGTRLVKKGTLLTPALHERLGRFAENGGLVEPLHVRMPRGAGGGAGTGGRPAR